MGGQPPVNDRRVGGKHNTVNQADSGLGGWMLRKFQGESLKPDHVLAFCQASFCMTLSQVGFLKDQWGLERKFRNPNEKAKHLTVCWVE